MHQKTDFSSPSYLVASEFFGGAGGVAGRAGQAQNLVRQSLCQGVDMFAWSGNYAQPVERSVLDDSGCIHFSYWLEGGARCWLDGRPAREALVQERTGCIGYAPGRQARFRQQGNFTNLMVLVTPEAFAPWGEGAEQALRRELASGQGFLNGHRGAELHATAHALYGALRGNPAAPRHPLWLQAKGMELVALFLEGREPPATAIPAAERRRLLAARDRLLADLGEPVTIGQLARESGLNALKLKRGFKQMFGIGVHGLFQRERMHEAHRRLRTDAASVATVAAELGYANASHFAAAFRKQFGVNPGEVKAK